jgi:hypothetical protein
VSKQHVATWSPKTGTSVKHSWLLLGIVEPCGERMATDSLRVCPHVCGGALQVWAVWSAERGGALPAGAACRQHHDVFGC